MRETKIPQICATVEIESSVKTHKEKIEKRDKINYAEAGVTLLILE